MIPGGGAFNAQLHPRAPGGKFAAKGTGSTAPAGQQRTAGRKPPARRGTAVQPNGLGYSAKQWAQLRQYAAMARAGKKLDRHQLHLLHQAHQRRLAALSGKSAAPRPRVRKAAPKRAAMPRKRTARAAVRKPRVTGGRRASPQQVYALRAAGYR